MTSGKMNQIKKYNVIALLILNFFFITPSFAVGVKKLDLPELLNLFAQQKDSTVDFTEEKYAFYLDEPIKSSGYLQFSAPDKLYKFISEPEKISQKINGDTLEIINGDETHSISLNEHPEFSIILRSIISLLSGNYAALKKDFKINFDNQAENWTLLLSPHDSFISGYVESIQMVGKKNKISRIIVIEPNKDRSITHIYNHR